MKKLINPFETFSEKQLLFFGLSATILGTFLGFIFNARFDGVLDLHFNTSVTWQEVAVDNLINLLTLSILYFIAGKIINPKTRAIDVLNISLICRIPFYILPFFNVNQVMFRSSQEIMENFQNGHFTEISSTNLILNLAFSVIAILLLLWFVILLWNGFKIATNAKGKKAIIVFIISLLLTEIVSKYLINYLNK